MLKKVLLILGITTILAACGSGTSSNGSDSNNKSTNNIQPDSKKAPDLQALLDTAINSKGVESSGITGIPLTFQCNGLYNNQSVSLSVGKISKDGRNLPTDAIYQIGSNTKSFTAVVALQLEAEGYFGAKGLDSTIGEILNSPASSKSWNESWNKITIRQLLNMTSGIPDYVDDAFLIYSDNPAHYFSTDDLIGFVVNKKPYFEPGQGWKYSNTNYVIVNKIISHVTNSTLNKQITSRIINKLGLTHTYYVDNIPMDSIANPAQQALLLSGYYTGSKIGFLNFGADLKLDSLSISNAAGSILSDTADMNTYVRALFANKDAGGLLAQTQLNELKYLVATENTDKYKAGQHINVVDQATKLGLFQGLGYGLGIMEVFVPLANGNHMTIYTHGGDTFGFHASWMYQEDKKASAIYVFNASLDKGIFDIRTTILDPALLDKISNECVVAKN